MSQKLSDKDFEEIKTSMNNAIHEIVFAAKHADDDELEDAAQCLITAQNTLDRVAERLVAAGA